MAKIDRDIEKLLGLLSLYEQSKFDVAGRKFLSEAIDLAVDILVDESKHDLHARIRTLIAHWFERVLNWQHLGTIRNPKNYITRKLLAENVQLFDQPQFALTSGIFANAAIVEAVNILSCKPASDWTASDHRVIEEFHRKLDLMSKAPGSI